MTLIRELHFSQEIFQGTKDVAKGFILVSTLTSIP